MIHGCPSRKPTRLGEESREGKKGSCETNAGALHKCCFSNQARVWPSQKRIAPTSPQHPQQVHLHTSLTTRFCNCMLLHIVQNEITKAFEIQVQMQTFPFQDVLHRTIHYKAFVLQMMFMSFPNVEPSQASSCESCLLMHKNAVLLCPATPAVRPDNVANEKTVLSKTEHPDRSNSSGPRQINSNPEVFVDQSNTHF